MQRSSHFICFQANKKEKGRKEGDFLKLLAMIITYPIAQNLVTRQHSVAREGGKRTVVSFQLALCPVKNQNKQRGKADVEGHIAISSASDARTL